MPRILLFTQPGCFSCELIRIYLEARALPFEELDISTDSAARRTMTETYSADETPTVVIFTTPPEVVTGFDPARLDLLLTDAA
jgi:arsenate reductase-like glutaredoxin family protein